MEKSTLLIIVDTYSKWVDAHVMSGTDARKTICKLKLTFSLLSFPQELVSDNGPPFCSRELNDFCSSNGIRLVHSPPYHPQSNGSAEKAVQSCKNNIKKQLLECTANLSMEEKLANYLMFVRNTPCVKTGESPADILLKKVPRTKLTMLKPDYNNYKSVNYQLANFKVGEKVYVKSSGMADVKWELGTVMGHVSGVTYDVNVKGVSKIYHAGHMKRCISEKSIKDEVPKRFIAFDDNGGTEVKLPEVSGPERSEKNLGAWSSPTSLTSGTDVNGTLSSSAGETKEVSKNVRDSSSNATTSCPVVESFVPVGSPGEVSPGPLLRRSNRVVKKPIKLDL